PGTLAALVPQPPPTGVVAIARRPAVDVAAILADLRPAPVVLLEQPRNMGNMGACVRVAAAADAAAVLTTGDNDPWGPDAVRGGAGLQFALPVAAVRTLPDLGGRPLLAIDPDGEDIDPGRLPARSVLAFGTERHGLSEELLARADARLAIPMRAGVSSLNLATTVAAVLFAWRLAAG
ncbi:MAG: rRNA methyltransferase, partial [Thermoleophilia bacterium]|nr:rRNA methyltransferase [Thermoleophilia bacterium]